MRIFLIMTSLSLFVHISHHKRKLLCYCWSGVTVWLMVLIYFATEQFLQMSACIEWTVNNLTVCL